MYQAVVSFFVIHNQKQNGICRFNPIEFSERKLKNWKKKLIKSTEVMKEKLPKLKTKKRQIRQKKEEQSGVPLL